MIIPESYLAHHGILGQKWGIRRFQNSDGSLTAAGRKHYNVGDSKNFKESLAENVGKTEGSTKNTTKNVNSKSKGATKEHKTLAQKKKDREKAKIAKAKQEEALKREALKQKEMERQAQIKAEEEANKEAFEAKKIAILKSDNPWLILQNSQMFSTQELSAASDRIRVLNALKQNVPKEEEPLTKFDETMKKFDNASTAIDKVGKLTESINNAAPKAAKAYNTMADVIGVATGGGVMLQKITAFDKKLTQNELLDLKRKEADTMRAQYLAKDVKLRYEKAEREDRKARGLSE